MNKNQAVIFSMIMGFITSSAFAGDVVPGQQNGEYSAEDYRKLTPKVDDKTKVYETTKGEPSGTAKVGSAVAAKTTTTAPKISVAEAAQRAKFKAAKVEYKTGLKEVKKENREERKALNDGYLTGIKALQVRAEAEKWPQSKLDKESMKLGNNYMNDIKELRDESRADVKGYKAENKKPKAKNYIDASFRKAPLNKAMRKELKEDRQEYRAARKEMREENQAEVEDLGAAYMKDLELLQAKAKAEKWSSEDFNTASLALANGYMTKAGSTRKENAAEMKAFAKSEKPSADDLRTKYGCDINGVCTGQPLGK